MGTFRISRFSKLDFTYSLAKIFFGRLDKDLQISFLSSLQENGGKSMVQRIIHQFDHHQQEPLPTVGSTAPSLPQVQRPPIQIPLQHVQPPPQVVRHPGGGLVYTSRSIHPEPQGPGVPHSGINIVGMPRSVHSTSMTLTNGARAPSSREGSLSSDSGEGRAASPLMNLKCEICGLTGITSNKALQQVIKKFSQCGNFNHFLPLSVFT